MMSWILTKKLPLTQRKAQLQRFDFQNREPNHASKMNDCFPKNDIWAHVTHTLTDFYLNMKQTMENWERTLVVGSYGLFENVHIPTVHTEHVGWTALFSCTQNNKFRIRIRFKITNAN